MFTGIIKATGVIEQMQPAGGDLRITVACDQLPWQEFETGESISVNGVCLTAVQLDRNGFSADVSLETINITALSELQTGSKVNLEPALRLGDRLGGHMVSGHVDCKGSVRERHDDGRSIRLAVEIPAEYQRYVARKGSICIDGVSLTINAVSDNVLETNIIPHTADVTIIGEYTIGSIVNIEVDLLARYLERLLTGKNDAGISMDYLRDHGYA